MDMGSSWRIVPFAIIWSMRMGRNSRSFKGVSSLVADIILVSLSIADGLRLGRSSKIFLCACLAGVARERRDPTGF